MRGAPSKRAILGMPLPELPLGPTSRTVASTGAAPRGLPPDRDPDRVVLLVRWEDWSAYRRRSTRGAPPLPPLGLSRTVEALLVLGVRPVATSFRPPGGRESAPPRELRYEFSADRLPLLVGPLESLAGRARVKMTSKHFAVIK